MDIFDTRPNLNAMAEAQAHELAAAKKELAAVTAQHAACLTELKAISDALGTNEGHSSVEHIRGLKAECVTLKRKILN